MDSWINLAARFVHHASDFSHWLVSLPQTKSKKPEIAAPQVVCDGLSAAPPKLFQTDSKPFEQISSSLCSTPWLYPINGG